MFKKMALAGGHRKIAVACAMLAGVLAAGQAAAQIKIGVTISSTGPGKSVV